MVFRANLGECVTKRDGSGALKGFSQSHLRLPALDLSLGLSPLLPAQLGGPLPLAASMKSHPIPWFSTVFHAENGWNWPCFALKC